jgi:Icc-related predicted phosphoesterase
MQLALPLTVRQCQSSVESLMPRIKLLYSADIHGSERCYRKWLNAVKVVKPDALIFGGDLTGKILHPITQTGSRWSTDLYGQIVIAETEAELDELQTRIRNAGRYDIVVTPEEKQALDASPERVHEAFLAAARATATRWLDRADARLRETRTPAFMMLGNDDYPELEDVFTQSEMVVNGDGRMVELPGGYQLVSLGYSNRTPWDSPRELDEVDLTARIDAIATVIRDPTMTVFNTHCPPIGTSLDVAAELDETLTPVIRGGHVQTLNVGSTAVHDAITRYQPILGLHGHIHESPGMAKVGRTVCINPGSDYVDGVLRAAVVTLDPKRGVAGWQLIQG